MISAKQSQDNSRYPLHYLVWHNKHRQLQKELSAGEQVDVESVDPRGRTPLHLAVTLGHLECARVLLQHGADVCKENRNGWTVLQEAISTRDPEIVRLVLCYRDYQRTAKRLAGIPLLLERLRQAEDFYVEMKWEFTSWVPLVSRICPSDTYRVWKSGQCLRVDTTLMGFEQMTWQRGNRSFIFRGQDSSATVMEVDHDRQLVFCETLCVSSLASPSSRRANGALGLLGLGALQPTEEQVAARLNAPVVTTQLDTRNISFERNKTGILGWQREKTETVNGYEAKVYAASNVELITRTRTDHLSEPHKAKPKSGKTPLQSFLGIAEQHIGPNQGPQQQTMVTQMCSVTNPTALTAEEYFSPSLALGQRDIGHPCHLTTKTQRFKAKLWLCESHPLSLAEQVAPIIDLMAISNALFAKLRDFITLRLPPGFPVKIEIPIYHILNARITFGNLNGCEEAAVSGRGEGEGEGEGETETETEAEGEVDGEVEGDGEGDGEGPKDGLRTETPSPGSDSSSVSSSSSSTSCRGGEISPCVFEAPPGYTVLGGTQRQSAREEEDDLLQFAIQQSLLEAGSEYDQVTIWEALTNSKPGTHSLSCDPGRVERKSQPPHHQPPPQAPRTPQRSSSSPCAQASPRCSPASCKASSRSYDEQLRLAMELSAREQEEAQRRRQQEDEELQRIIRLSLTEK
ncbi:ankyrin repeat domain-containing protein 13B [Engraulis encrasicolus]|uniref:ankyrin repeat domain-containing protein 13B n=1 Tax=Engraulis encrasicolus TaxID=184585 RepID=UPI002FD0FCD8